MTTQASRAQATGRAEPATDPAATPTSRRARRAAPRGIADLTFDQPVSRAIIHKTGIGEVFITDSVEVTPQRVMLAGELPRSHAFYSDTSSAPRGGLLMPAIEVMRQAVYVVVYRHWGHPIDEAYVMRNFDVALTPEGAALQTAVPTPVLIDLRVTDEFHRGGVRCGARTEMDMHAVDGPLLASYGMSFSWMRPDAWKALRAAGGPVVVPEPRTAPHDGLVAPASVGRTHPSNVVLAEPTLDAAGRFRGLLRSDPHHTPLYDHPGDHVAGLVLAEGFRQLAVWSASQRLACGAADLVVDALDGSFSSIAEFEGELICEGRLAETATGLLARITARQEGRVVGESTAAVRRA